MKLAFTLDEGLVVTKGILPGIDQPVAVIGTAERGVVTLKVTANGTTTSPVVRGVWESRVGQTRGK